MYTCIVDKLVSSCFILLYCKMCLMNRRKNQSILLSLVRKERPTLKKPADVEIIELEDACLEATVGGKPDPVVEW